MGKATMSVREGAIEVRDNVIAAVKNAMMDEYTGRWVLPNCADEVKAGGTVVVRSIGAWATYKVSIVVVPEEVV